MGENSINEVSNVVCFAGNCQEVKKQVLELVCEGDDCGKRIHKPKLVFFPFCLPCSVSQYCPWYRLHRQTCNSEAPFVAPRNPPHNRQQSSYTPLANPRPHDFGRLPHPHRPRHRPALKPALPEPLTWTPRPIAAPTVSHARRSSNPLRPRHLPASSATTEQIEKRDGCFSVSFSVSWGLGRGHCSRRLRCLTRLGRPRQLRENYRARNLFGLIEG